MQLFYSEEIKNNTLFLYDDEFRHCTKVLRKTTGDTLSITDGKGNLYEAKIAFVSKKHLEAEITNTLHQPAPTNQLHIALAPTKNMDRTEWAVEKMVEIGVQRVSFLLCEHSERKVLKTERLKKIALSAMKQSLKYYLPQIDELQSFEEFIATVNPKEQNLYIGYCESEATQYLLNIPFTAKETVVLIGPEGDFSPAEIELAKQKGIIPISLGNSRLRTETAAVVATTLVNTKFETTP